MPHSRPRDPLAKLWAEKRIPSLRRYTPADYPLLESWFEGRGMKAPREADLPPTGFIADGRVMGFLMFTDANLALVECVIADPRSIPSFRKASVRKLCGFLTDFALAIGYGTVGGISSHPAIGRVAKELGYEVGDHTVFMLRDRG